MEWCSLGKLASGLIHELSNHSRDCRGSLISLVGEVTVHEPCEVVDLVHPSMVALEVSSRGRSQVLVGSELC